MIRGENKLEGISDFQDEVILLYNILVKVSITKGRLICIGKYNR